MDLLHPYIAEADPARGLSDDDVIAICQTLDHDPDDDLDAQQKLREVCRLISEAPHHPRPQLLAAHMLERSRRRDDMLDTWAGIHDRFPDSHTALRFRLRWLAREHRNGDAVALLNSLPPPNDAGRHMVSRRAELLSEIRNDADRDRLFEDLIARFPDNTQTRVIYGKTLFARGRLTKALAVLDPVRDQRLSPTARAVIDQSDRAVAAMATLDGGSGDLGAPAILRNAIGLFARRGLQRMSDTRIGGITLYTGSLGAGGAERQMSETAIALRARTRNRRRVQGVAIDGPVEVIVNNTDAARGKDFHLPRLREAGVPVHITASMAAASPDIPADLGALAPLLPLLPRNARFGIERLAAHLAQRQPDVFHIWQDGAVLTGALAALIARVPRIAISLRGLPPVLRPHLMKPEYLDMYQALANVPGVAFASNSATAAQAYADWTGIARDRFSVIYNATEPLHTTPTPQSRMLFAEFDARTRGTTATMGGVFRFDPNKRGPMWVDWAAGLATRHPGLRFILVGDGKELGAAREMAARHGLSQQMLFVGATRDVGFWLSKCDFVTLLSRAEGLPNVLIEAQLAGCPVISTPAGGAAETFAHETTGFLLSDAEHPDFEEFAGFVARFLSGDPGFRTMGEAAIAPTRARHDPALILSQTVRFLMGGQVDGPNETARRNVAAMETPHARQNFDKQVADAYNLLTGR